MIKVRNVSAVPQDIGAGRQLEPGAEGIALDDPSVIAAIEGGGLIGVEPQAESEPEPEPQAESEPEPEPEAKPKTRRATAKTKTKEDT